jgi:hypothetical protein
LTAFSKGLVIEGATGFMSPLATCVTAPGAAELGVINVLGTLDELLLAAVEPAGVNAAARCRVPTPPPPVD